jgi:hypothetical protein
MGDIYRLSIFLYALSAIRGRGVPAISPSNPYFEIGRYLHSRPPIFVSTNSSAIRLRHTLSLIKCRPILRWVTFALGATHSRSLSGGYRLKSCSWFHLASLVHS